MVSAYRIYGQLCMALSDDTQLRVSKQVQPANTLAKMYGVEDEGQL